MYELFENQMQSIRYIVCDLGMKMRFAYNLNHKFALNSLIGLAGRKLAALRCLGERGNRPKLQTYSHLEIPIGLQIWPKNVRSANLAYAMLIQTAFSSLFWFWASGRAQRIKIKTRMSFLFMDLQSSINSNTRFFTNIKRSFFQKVAFYTYQTLFSGWLF